MFSDDIDFVKQLSGDNKTQTSPLKVALQLKSLIEKEKNNLSEENREIIFTKLNEFISSTIYH